MTLERRKDFLTILVAIISGIKFRYLGTFYAGEILLYIMLFFISWRPIFNNRYASNIFKLALLWLLSAYITDIWVNNSIINTLKGEFNIIFFMAQFPGVYWLLYDKPKRFLYFLIAVGVVSIPNLYLFGPEVDESDFGMMGENIWLYYYLVPIAIGCISWLYYKGKITAPTATIMMLCFGIFMLFHNSRNVFLTMTLSAILLYQIDRTKGQPFHRRVSMFRVRIVNIFIMLFLGALIVNSVYESLASRHILGEYAYQKYQTQIQADNILEGGRAETFMGIELIRRKPIIGYGSYAMDKGDKFHKEFASTSGKKYRRPFEERRMPAHSHIVGAWMWNGIGGGIFWLYVLLLMWRVFRSGAMLTESALLPGILMTFTARIWEILFSPFGLRIPETFFLMFLTIIYNNFKNHNIKQPFLTN